MAVRYHWKHGWIPLDHTAALSKAKGDHDLADKMLADAPRANGIQSRQDVAKAVRDLPNVPSSHRSEAATHLREAAAKHDSIDLLPGGRHTGPVARKDPVKVLKDHGIMDNRAWTVGGPDGPVDTHNLSEAELSSLIAKAKSDPRYEGMLSGLLRERRWRLSH